MSEEVIGLIAGGGRLPFLFARAARDAGLRVAAVGHRGETDPALRDAVASFDWVRVGQISALLKTLRRAGARKAVMAGGIGRVRALTQARPDFGALQVLLRLGNLRDDALLRAVAEYFESNGITIVAPTDYLKELLAPEGPLAGPALSKAQQKDVVLGMEVARALGQADVGQTVVVRGGNVLALEAVEGTDETIRRGAKLGGRGVVVVKRCKPGQDTRFDLPAIGPATLDVMNEVGAAALAIEAGKTLLLDVEATVKAAERFGIAVTAVRP